MVKNNIYRDRKSRLFGYLERKLIKYILSLISNKILLLYFFKIFLFNFNFNMINDFIRILISIYNNINENIIIYHFFAISHQNPHLSQNMPS